MWNKKILYYSSLISAVLNFLVSVIYLRIMGIESFGQLMMFRSAIQLTSNVNFGASYALMLLIPRNSLKNNFEYINKLHYLSTLMMYLWYFISFLIWILIFKFANIDNKLLFALMFFGFSVSLSGYYSQVAKSYKNGKKLLKSAKVDIIGIGIMLIVLVFSESMILFIYTLGIRFFIKAYFLYIPINKKYEITGKEIRLSIQMIYIGFPLMIKGWIQTAQQYSDKLLYGLFFSEDLAGLLSLGSMIALPIIMYISVVSTLIISKVKENNICKFLYKEYSYIIFITSILIIFINFLPKNIIGYFFESDKTILISVSILFSILLNIQTPLSNILYTKLFFKDSIMMGFQILILTSITLLLSLSLNLAVENIFIILNILLSVNIVYLSYKYMSKIC